MPQRLADDVQVFNIRTGNLMERQKQSYISRLAITWKILSIYH